MKIRLALVAPLWIVITFLTLAMAPAAEAQDPQLRVRAVQYDGQTRCGEVPAGRVLTLRAELENTSSDSAEVLLAVARGGLLSSATFAKSPQPATVAPMTSRWVDLSYQVVADHFGNGGRSQARLILLDPNLEQQMPMAMVARRLFVDDNNDDHQPLLDCTLQGTGTVELRISSFKIDGKENDPDDGHAGCGRKIAPGDMLEIEVQLKNSGNRTSPEVVLAWASPLAKTTKSYEQTAAFTVPAGGSATRRLGLAVDDHSNGRLASLVTLLDPAKSGTLLSDRRFEDGDRSNHTRLFYCRQATNMSPKPNRGVKPPAKTGEIVSGRVKTWAISEYGEDELYFINFKFRVRAGESPTFSSVYNHQSEVFDADDGEGPVSLSPKVGTHRFSDLKPYDLFGVVSILMEEDSSSDGVELLARDVKARVERYLRSEFGRLEVDLTDYRQSNAEVVVRESTQALRRALAGSRLMGDIRSLDEKHVASEAGDVDDLADVDVVTWIYAPQLDPDEILSIYQEDCEPASPSEELMVGLTTLQRTRTCCTRSGDIDAKPFLGIGVKYLDKLPKVKAPPRTCPGYGAGINSWGAQGDPEDRGRYEVRTRVSVY